MFRFVLFCLMCSAFASKTFAQQNLVPNPSFEEYTNCPIDPWDFSVVHWNSPTIASPDYFNNCNMMYASVPDNSWGSQLAFSGNAYVGIGGIIMEADYNEYVQTPLLQTLSEGQRYFVSFYVSLAEKSRFAIREIGAYFSSNAMSTNEGFTLLRTPQIQFNDSIITDTIGWTKISGSFIANGDERFITIGNFNIGQNTSALELKDENERGSYYYIDEVSVFTNVAMPSAFSPNNDGKNDVFATVVLSSVQIETFRIYNRWGQMVFESWGVNTVWDGKYMEVEQTAGVYLYHIQVKNTITGDTEKRTGSFTLLR